MKFTKIFVNIFLLGALFMLPAKVGAIELNIISRESMGFDERLSQSELAGYREPEEIIIARIETKATELTSDSNVWASQLYYHYITRLGFVDIPYNFLLSEDGKLYQGREGYVGVLPELESPRGVILIGYMSNNPRLTSMAEKSLRNFITDISMHYPIEKDKVNSGILQHIDGKSLTDQEEVSPSKIRIVGDYQSLFSRNIDQAKENIFSNITSSDIDHRYFASVQVREYDQMADSGENLEVELLIKNEGDYPLFLESSPLFIRTLDGNSSEFFINGQWSSQSVVKVIDEGFMLPGEERVVPFSLYVGVMPTEEDDLHEQSFLLAVRKKDANYLAEGSEFTVKFGVKKGDLDIIRITDTGVGYINMRSCAGRNCEVITTIPVGERIIAEAFEDSWIKVRYQEKEGWIVNSYYRTVE